MLRLLTAGVEITVLSVIIYYLILFLRGTGAVQALRGMLFLGLIVALSRILRLEVLFSIFARSLPFLFLAFVVICFGAPSVAPANRQTIKFSCRNTGSGSGPTAWQRDYHVVQQVQVKRLNRINS